jgi:hypothetical protein
VELTILSFILSQMLREYAAVIIKNTNNATARIPIAVPFFPTPQGDTQGTMSMESRSVHAVHLQ